MQKKKKNLPETLHLTSGGFRTIAGQNIALPAGAIEGEKSVAGSISPKPLKLDWILISSPRLASEKAYLAVVNLHERCFYLS